MRLITLFASVSVVFALTFSTASVAQADYVKLSNSGICHDKSSAFYERTKNFKMYATMDTCIKAGGRAAKSNRATTSEQSLSNNSSGKYNRKDWKHWSDFDGDCQNTRAEILISQSSTPVRFSDARKCYVTTGKWYDPYSGRTFTNDDDLDIDHIL